MVTVQVKLFCLVKDLGLEKLDLSKASQSGADLTLGLKCPDS